MALYDRLLGRDDSGAPIEAGKIPVHQFQALMAEVARGRISGAQAQTAVVALSGLALSASEVTEAQTLLATVAGTAAAKLARAKEIDDVLLLAEASAPGYDTPALVKTRLGV